jgi:hypothetical protein
MNLWPTVHQFDAGVAEGPGADTERCAFCGQKVGSPHAKNCLVVKRRVKVHVLATLPSGDYVGSWEYDEAYFRTPELIEFRLNESDWCATNFLKERGAGTVKWHRGLGREESGYCKGLAGDPWNELEAISKAGTQVAALAGDAKPGSVLGSAGSVFGAAAVAGEVKPGAPGGCLCGCLRFQFACVVDDTPRREVRREGLS